jgi:probable rRNA maturation factor
MATIRVRNLQRKVPINLAELNKFAAKALAYCLRLPRRKSGQLSRLSEIFVLLVSDCRMARLHRQFLNQPGPTDVLTFQHGEIVISVETARRNARAFGTSLQRELRLYIAHGLLHLHGFDDQTDAGARKMKETQEKILAALSQSE